MKVWSPVAEALVLIIDGWLSALPLTRNIGATQVVT